MDNTNTPATPPTSIPSDRYRVLKLSILVIMLMLISGVVGYLIGEINISRSFEKQQKVSKNNQIVNPQITKTQHATTCLKQGIQPKSDYLPVYTVKPGDSLLSIAKSELKDGSRVTELITLNSDRYPELSLSKPFIEQGWKLYLPPQNLGVTNGYIFVISGNVEINPSHKDLWGVSYSGGNGGTFSVEELTKNSLKPGDCVSVLYQGGGDTKLFSVTRQ